MTDASGPTPPPTYAELRERLAAAIQAIAHHDGGGGVLIDYVVVTAEYRPQPDGGEQAVLGWLGSEQQPTYRAAGLIEWARVSMRERYE